jgi:hypothetical protein
MMLSKVLLQNMLLKTEKEYSKQPPLPMMQQKK